MKKALSAISLCLLLLGGCAEAPASPPQAPTETTTETDIPAAATETLPTVEASTQTKQTEQTEPEAPISEEADEVCTEEILEALLEKNREFHGMFDFYQGIKWIGESGDVVEIEFKNYENFDEFSNAIHSTYTEEYAAYLLENFLGKGEKSFFEDENGKIFINDYIFGIAVVDEFRYGRESYTFQIISSDSSVCEFLFSFRMWNEYGSPLPGVLCGEDTIVTLKCKAVREKDGWRLPYMICHDYDQTEYK